MQNDWKNIYDKRLPKHILDYYIGLADINLTDDKIKHLDLSYPPTSFPQPQHLANPFPFLTHLP